MSAPPDFRLTFSDALTHGLILYDYIFLLGSNYSVACGLLWAHGAPPLLSLQAACKERSGSEPPSAWSVDSALHSQHDSRSSPPAGHGSDRRNLAGSGDGMASGHHLGDVKGKDMSPSVFP